ncbi:MAG: complex I NDUFA9 subunit family protein [Halorhodospira sp.]
MDVKTVGIIGGTGFVGRHVANRLVEQGYRVRVLTRRWYRGRDLLPLPRLQLIEADVHDERELVRHLGGCEAVINLAGILNERRGARGEDFRQVHVELPQRVLEAARRAGVPRYLHMGALGASPEAPSGYLRTKGEGEQRVLASDPQEVAVTSFRPSVIFGAGDHSLSRLAGLARLAPGILLLPSPAARLQPVYVGDVARALVAALEDFYSAGRAYELCGPRVYTLRELVAYVVELRGLRRRVVGLPAALSKLSARLLGALPGRPLTLDNYRSTEVPSCCQEDGLAELGIRATPLEAVAPAYLGREGRQSRYQEARQEAGR